MSLVFETESGSTYEVQNNKIRRLRGLADPTPRVGEDGQWKKFYEMTKVKKGSPVLITWTDGVQPAPIDGTVPTTLTSRVVRIVPNMN